MSAKKDKSFSTRKLKTIGKRPWPNLPQKLLSSIAKNPNFLHQMSYPGTTKSWIATTKRCNTNKLPQHPQLQDLEGSNKWRCLKNTLPQFIDIDIRPQAGYEWWHFYTRDPSRHFRHDPSGHFVGYSNGSLIIRGPNPSCLKSIQLSFVGFDPVPQWDTNISFRFAAISTSNSGALNYMVVVTGVSSPAFLVCNISRFKWIKYDCDVIDPYDSKKQPMKFANVIGFEGKFYALSLQGTLVVMEKADSGLVTTGVGRSRAVPCAETRYFKEHLLESNGELLLVFLIYKKKLDVVDGVEVFKLSFPRLSWVKVESLHERALFLESESCIWVDSRRVDCRGNCVYFAKNSAAKDWCTYDMGNGCISPGLIWSEPMLEE